MSEYRMIRTDEDFARFMETCNNFNNVEIISVKQFSGPFGRRVRKNTLILNISGEGIPPVEIVFHGALYLKLDNKPILKLTFKKIGPMRYVDLWHEHSLNTQKIHMRSLIIARSIEWQCTES